jgi:hypothetical protein
MTYLRGRLTWPPLASHLHPVPDRIRLAHDRLVGNAQRASRQQVINPPVQLHPKQTALGSIKSRSDKIFGLLARFRPTKSCTESNLRGPFHPVSADLPHRSASCPTLVSPAWRSRRHSSRDPVGYEPFAAPTIRRHATQTKPRSFGAVGLFWDGGRRTLAHADTLCQAVSQSPFDSACSRGYRLTAGISFGKAELSG